MSVPLSPPTNAVLMQSAPMPAGSLAVRGYDFNKGVDYHALLQSFRTSGFQATNFGLAVEEVQKMLAKRSEPLVITDPETHKAVGDLAPRNNCTIFLGYTSNMISCGVRDTIRFLVQHKLVDIIVTTAGGIEEDFMQCIAPTYLGEFSLPGAQLRDKGHNRIGNLLVPNNNYIDFENWLIPILDFMHEEQEKKGVLWTPSKMIRLLGERINNPDSVYYWAWKNDIPVFSPAITDGAIGDAIYIHAFKKQGLVLDIVGDIRSLDGRAQYSHNTGMIILGGGLIKHHVCNANLMRDGADFSVYINTAQEFDGSDAGARPDEAVSWGKIKKTATPVKVYGEASIIFPLLVAETFAKATVTDEESAESTAKS